MLYTQSMFMHVFEIMDRDIIKVEERNSLNYAVEMMLLYGRDEVIVVNKRGEKENVEGILTKTDISLLKRKKVDFTRPVKDYMSIEVEVISASETAKTARDRMMSRGIGRMPVIEGDKVIGIITAKDLLNTFYLRVEEIELQLRTILENLHEAVCVVNTRGIVTFWNKSSEKLYGVKSSEIIGKNIKDFFPNALLTKVIEEKRPFENYTNRPKEGSYVAISAIPLIYENRMIGAVSTDRDITDITNLSMQLEKEKSRVKFLEEQMKTITESKYSFGQIIGKSKSIMSAITLAKQVAKSNASILITGESGTGKEVFARAIHQESGRKGHFVPLNCSAIPFNLLESELFGYEGGAFTGALKKGKMGKFELANGGTLFLDEIGDMPLEMQAKLLRVLQDGVITRIGGDKLISVDVRILAATHKDLRKMMAQGTFREDLYYRLNVVSLYLPPLRERKEDIPELIKSFLDEFAKYNGMLSIDISPEVMKILTDYEWQGNIRELRNTVERLVILSPSGRIEKDKLPDYIIETIDNKQKEINNNIEENLDLESTVANVEKNIIKKAMEAAGGNKAKAAELLKIKRSTLYYKLNQYEMKEYL